jgi:hypothetical protein
MPLTIPITTIKLTLLTDLCDPVVSVFDAVGPCSIGCVPRLHVITKPTFGHSSQ